VNKENVLIIPDTHIPFELKGVLEFCLDVQKKYQCGTVVHIGDLVDNHSISYHEHDPNGLSPADEMREADKHLIAWFKAFPELSLTLGNHDKLVDRKSKTSGLPDRAFKQFREIWNLPTKWKTGFDFEFYNVRYQHGTGFSGLRGHALAAESNRQSTVIGHLHSIAGIEWSANPRDCIFGMCVGSGVDRKSLAFDYGKDYKRKPVISCGVVLEGGRYPLIVPMALGQRLKLI
jgi:predicted phosphodiesterase